VAVAYKWIVLSNTTIGSLMASIDTTIVLIALPNILVNLPQTSVNDGVWMVLGYELVTSTLILNFGRLGDMFGRVKMYNFGFALFTVGSFLCSLSQTGLELIALRLFQGIGAALIWSNSSAIIADAFPLAERGKALGINQAAVVSGTVVGLVLGGVLTSLLGWRSIFWINVPIGIFATFWAYYQLKEIAKIKKGEKLDISGNVTFAVGLTLVLIGITFGALNGFDVLTEASLLIGAVLLLIFVWIEAHVKDPMIQITLFKNRVFSSGNFAALFFSLARGAYSFVLVFYFQGPLGFDPLTAGLLLIPTSATVVLFGPLSGWLSDLHGPKWFAVGGLAIMSVAFIVFSQLPGNVAYTIFVIPMILLGIGSGMFSSPNRNVTLISVPPFRRGIAAGTNSTIANIGIVLSLGISVVLLAASVPRSILLNVFDGISSGSAIGLSSFTTGMHDMWYFCAIASLLGIIPVTIGYGSMTELKGDGMPNHEKEDEEEEEEKRTEKTL